MLIVHLSDLHLDSTRQMDQQITCKALCEDLRLMKAELGQPALVLFSGDLVNRGADKHAFDAVLPEFVNPICEAVGLSTDEFLVAPGNHDVDTSAIDEFVEAGLETKLIDRPRVNDFLDKVDQYPAAIQRMACFESFHKSIRSRHCLATSRLATTYRITTDDGVIDIACLNSAWRATGRPNDADRERLLIGERQVDWALKSFGSAPRHSNLRLAVFHHPIDWLTNDDRRHSGARLLADFDGLFFGHNHNADPQHLQSLLGTSFVSQAGCLYQSRDYHNGYSIIQWDRAAHSVTAHLREYFDFRRSFDKCTRLAAEGRRAFQLPSSRLGPRNLSAIQSGDLYASLLTGFNQTLLSANGTTQAPSDLSRIFVEPPLATVAEQIERHALHKAIESPTPRPSHLPISVAQIVSSHRHAVILGKPHYGRTTLLHWLCLSLARSDAGTPRAAFYLRFSDVPRSSLVLERKVGELARAHGLNFNEEQTATLLRSGACTLLFDDVEVADGFRLRAIRELATKYPQCRLILSANDDLWNSLNVTNPVELGAPYDTIHIRPLARAQVRELVRKWRGNQAAGTDEIADEAIRALRRMRVPATAFMVSSVLCILEAGKQASLINYSALLETLLEGFLDKAESSRADRGLMDYRNREHYLASIAWRMNERNEYAIARADLDEETQAYFKNLALKVSTGEVIDYMLRRGIFVQDGDNVSFKYACFCRYFIARRLIEDADARAIVLRSEVFLDFSQELDILTALQRNNGELLEFVLKELDAAIAATGGALDLKWFDALGSSVEKPWTETERTVFLEQFQEPQDPRGGQEFLDQMDSVPVAPSQTIQRVRPQRAMERVWRTLDLCSAVLRNCELIGEAQKRKAFEVVMGVWAQLLVALSLLIEERILDGSMTAAFSQAREVVESQAAQLGEAEERNGKEGGAFEFTEEDFTDLVRLMPSGIVMGTLHDTVGTPKLEKLLLERLEDYSQPVAVQLLDVMLYSDLKLPNYIRQLRGFVHRFEKRRVVLEVVLVKACGYYMMRTLSREAARDLEGVIGEIVSRLGKTGYHLADMAEKNAAVAAIRKRRRLWTQRFGDESASDSVDD